MRTFQQKPLLGQQINWAHPLARGLVGCWVMNEGSGDRLTDLSGNNNYGTFKGSGEPEWISGRVGQALNFDGSDDYVDCGNGSSVDITGNAVSLVAWIKKSSAQAGDIRIIDKSAALTGYSLYTYDNKLGGKVGNGSFNYYKTSTTSVPVDEWHYTGMTSDGSILKVFYDGVEIANRADISGNIVTEVDNAYIGRYAQSNTQNFAGLIDVALIYDRVLNVGEIAWLYREPYEIFKGTGFDPSIWDAGIGSINIGDSWKDIENIQINIGDVWKDYSQVQVNISDTWKNTA